MAIGARRSITVLSVLEGITMVGVDSEFLVGLVIRTTPSYGEEIIKKLERDPKLRIIYAKRTTIDKYLLVLETERVGKRKT